VRIDVPNVVNQTCFVHDAETGLLSVPDVVRLSGFILMTRQLTMTLTMSVMTSRFAMELHTFLTVIGMKDRTLSGQPGGNSSAREPLSGSWKTEFADLAPAIACWRTDNVSGHPKPASEGRLIIGQWGERVRDLYAGCCAPSGVDDGERDQQAPETDDCGTARPEPLQSDDCHVVGIAPADSQPSSVGCLAFYNDGTPTINRDMTLDCLGGELAE